MISLAEGGGGGGRGGILTDTVDNVIGVGKNFYVNFNVLLNFS